MKASQDNSSMRYFMASLKPFGSPWFWGPLGLLALGLIVGWQYQQHPEWLSTVEEQPPQSIDGNFSNLPTNDSQTQQQTPTELKPGLDPTQILTLPTDPRKRSQTTYKSNIITTNPSTQTSTTTQDNKTSSLFMPLLPTVKQSPQANSSQTLNPIKVEPVPTREYPLQRAIENIPSYQSNYNRYSGYNNYTSSGTPTNTGAYGNNGVNQYNSSAQVYQTPYYGQGNRYNPSSGQNYQTPYSNSPYANNYYGQPNTVNPSGQNYQPYQSPYSNYNSSQPSSSVPQTQGNNYNNYAGQNYQGQGQSTYNTYPRGY